MASSIPTKEEQPQLSANLRLLDWLGYCDLDMLSSPAIASNGAASEKNVRWDLRILDVIAVCLTTGNAGNVVAAAFYKEQKISLVLAKSSNVEDADNDRVAAFLSTIRNANNWLDILPFLAKYSRKNVKKRIEKLHKSISALDLELEVVEYEFKSVTAEFPRSQHYLSLSYPDKATPEFILSDLVNYCKTMSTIKFQNDQLSFKNFVRLTSVANVLRNCAFLNYLTTDTKVGPERRFEAARLKRRLTKVYQYTRIDQVIGFCKRYPGDIPVYWIKDQYPGTGEGLYDMPDGPMDVVKHALDEPAAQVLTASISQLVPAKKWGQLSFNPRLHTELRIILHLARTLPRSPTLRKTMLPIGCSKRSCLCCTLWMKSFNQNSSFQWMTGGSHGKPYENWALPGDAGRMGIRPDPDETVIAGIHHRLVQELDTLMPEQLPRKSDELASTGSDNYRYPKTWESTKYYDELDRRHWG
ncbi:hypothetical protein Hypma_010726 [Hypsizygus marmoreus]|uniref:Uncharacterized protein n=1 Tax=Hypsizygus marmoreus TaxID=39966 RepID=A0A369JTY7_HYPMA|nr:hypothetical protein Hypma_010726 [Hypsizygus marmoreus]